MRLSFTSWFIAVLLSWNPPAYADHRSSSPGKARASAADEAEADADASATIDDLADLSATGTGAASATPNTGTGPGNHAQARTSSFGAGLDVYSDSGQQSIVQINSGGGDLVQGRKDLSGDSMVLGTRLGLALSLMTEVLPKLSVGASLRLLGGYSYKLADRGNTVGLGQLVELAPRVQYLLAITDKVGVSLGAELGLATLFPGKDLSRRIDALSAQGFNTNSLPRLGFVGGPEVGLRYLTSDWLALHVDLAYLWEKLFLLDASAQSGGLHGSEQWNVSWVRFRVNLGAELLF